MSVTVVDQAGRAKVVVRDDGAAPHTAEHSLRKAVIGAVGVSGTPSSAGGGEGDAKCAEAGISEIAK